MTELKTRKISELTQAASLQDTALFVAEQNGRLERVASTLLQSSVAGVGEAFVNAAQALSLPKDDTGDISAALNEALGNGTTDGPNALPVGTTLVFEAGRYRTLSPIIQKRDVNIILTKNAQIHGVFSSDITADVWTVAVEAGLNGYNADSRQMIMRGGGQIAIAAGLQGRHALSIGDGTTLSAFNTHVHDLQLTGAGINGGRGLYVTGYVGGTDNGPTFSKFDNLSCYHGVHLDGVADGTVFQNGMVFGNYGFAADIVEGGYCTRIANNYIGSQGLDVLNASQIVIENNQFEIDAAETSALSVDGVSCQLALRGTARTISGATVRDNNFGGGVGRVDIPMIVDNCVQSEIGGNKFNPGDLDIDIRFTADAKHNIVGPNNRPRGTRTGAPYDARPDMKLRVQELGAGNMGFKRYSADMGLSNGWTNAECYVTKDATGLLHFEGRLIPGTLTAATLIMTLPVGLRPVTATQMRVATDDVLGVAALTVATTGEVRFGGATGTAPTLLYMDGVTMQAQARHDYADIK